MKNNKWLTYTLGTLLTLVVLAVVAGISYRIGLTRNPAFARPAITQNFNGTPRFMQRNFAGNGGPQGPQGDFQNNNGSQRMQGNRPSFGHNNWGGNHRSERPSFLFPVLFGLAHFVVLAVVLGLIIWVVIILVRKSGWKLTRIEATPASVPTASLEEVGKKKTSK